MKNSYVMYILPSMTDYAKIFRTGGSQAVRLPKEYRFEGDRVRIHRQGRRVILEGVRKEWGAAFVALGGTAPDFPAPAEPPETEPGPDLD